MALALVMAGREGIAPLFRRARQALMIIIR